MKNGKDKHTELQELLAILEKIEAEIRDIEAAWGGPPQKINAAQYMYDPVMWNTIAQARLRYSFLLEEREIFKEMAHALQRQLEEVRP